MLQIQYRVSDGFIQSLWDANPPSLLLSQDTSTDPAYTTALVDSTLSPTMIFEGYYMQDGVMVEKLMLTLTATPNPFPANGVTECQVTVTPFVPCTLLVDNQPMTLAASDPVLEITASTPHTFVISLEPMAAYRAATITAEAT